MSSLSNSFIEEPPPVSFKKFGVDLAVAIFCGASTGTLFCMIGAERPVRACVKDLLVSLMAFVSVAVFCRYIISERVKRVLPSWMVIAIFGSLIWEMYLSASTSPVICTAVGKPPLPGFILGELLHIGKSWVLKSLLVLPIAAIVYYVSEIPKLIMRKRYR